MGLVAKVTKAHRGKMFGMVSVQSGLTPKRNGFCQAMQSDEKTICSDCYMCDLMKACPAGQNAWEYNHNNDVDPAIVGGIDVARFNAFVELADSSDLRFIIDTCNANPDTHFTLWTKQHGLVNWIFQKVTKPDNLRLIYSWPWKERSSDAPGLRKRIDEFAARYLKYIWSDVFVVAEKGRHQCGKRACRSCMRCYGPKRGKKLRITFERSKKG